MTNHPIRIAVLGFWHVHAADYARQAVEHPGTELVAVWDDDVDRGRAGAERFGVEFAADLDALLARDDIDAVTVTTATSAHRDGMVKVAAAGKHIYTEKVLAPTVAEAEEIVRAADEHDVRLVVSLPRLYHAYTEAIADVIESGSLGSVTYGRVRLSHGGATKDWLPPQFYDPTTAIGGALTDLGCHPVYLMQRFLGSAPESVSATYRSVTNRPVEDHAVVTVGYGDQSIGVIEAGLVGPDVFTIEILGTEGGLRYTADGRRLSAWGAAFGEDTKALELPADRPDPFAQWVDHIVQGTRADDNIARAVELTRLVVAANRSAATGTAVVP